MNILMIHQASPTQQRKSNFLANNVQVSFVPIYCCRIVPIGSLRPPEASYMCTSKQISSLVSHHISSATSSWSPRILPLNTAPSSPEEAQTRVKQGPAAKQERKPPSFLCVKFCERPIAVLLEQCSPECLLPALLSALVLMLVFNGAQRTKPDREIPPGSILHLPSADSGSATGSSLSCAFFLP